MAGCLVVFGGLGGVIFALWLCSEQRIGCIDRNVVAHTAVAIKDLVDHFLTVDCVFQRQTQVLVVEWRCVGRHVEHIMTASGHVFNNDTGCLAKQFRNFGVNTVDDVNLTGLQRRGARGVVIDDGQFHTIVVTACCVPIGRVPFKDIAHARLGADQFVGAGADGRTWVVNAALGLHDKVIVRQKVGQVSVARRHLEDDFVAFGGNLGDALHDAKGTRFGVFIRVALEGGDDVIHRHVAAIMEFHALTDRKAPFRAICV